MQPTTSLKPFAAAETISLPGPGAAATGARAGAALVAIGTRAADATSATAAVGMAQSFSTGHVGQNDSLTAAVTQGGSPAPDGTQVEFTLPTGRKEPASLSALEEQPVDPANSSGELREAISTGYGGAARRRAALVVDKRPEATEFGDTIYRCYAPELLKFATGLVGPWEAADIVHDVIVRCLQTPTWNRVVDKKAYLYRAVANASCSHHRAFGRRQDRLRTAGIHEPAAPHEPELRSEVWEAVLTLSIRQRAVIILTYWQDMAPEQIAERLQIGEGSVKQHLARARHRLRRIVSHGEACPAH